MKRKIVFALAMIGVFIYCSCEIVPEGQAGTSSSTTTSSTIQKRVVIVIANYHFYYQEYADPRTAIEARGIDVTVAAGTTETAIPHPSTGQPEGQSGDVEIDLAIESVDAGDFDALVIAGGWGASTYYFAHPGTIGAPYTVIPDRAAELNQLIVDFLTAGKPVMGVCNGVNVLSWARLDGELDGLSPLSGKNVSAPYLNVPPQTYLGSDYDDDPGTAEPPLLMHVFAADNGAIVKDYNSVGDSNLNTDDVSVDGLIITVQDNFSALHGGNILADILLE